MDDEKMRLLLLSEIKGLSNKGRRALVGYFKDTSRIFSCPESEIKSLWFLNDREKDALLTGRKDPVSKDILESLKSNSISFVTVNEKEYPMMLLDVFNPPFIIFYRGTLPKEDEECVAMVGARRCSSYGKKRHLPFLLCLQRTTFRS